MRNYSSASRARPKEKCWAVATNNDRVELRVHLHRETAKAYGVSRTGPGTPFSDWLWLPKVFTLCCYVGLTNGDKERLHAAGRPSEDFWPYLINLPRWLARDRGLI